MSWEAWGDPDEPPETKDCEDCNGTGFFNREACTVDGIFYPAIINQKCETCKGDGFLILEDQRFEDDVI